MALLGLDSIPGSLMIPEWVTPEPDIPGDHDGDHSVTLIDLLIVKSGLGTQFDRTDVATVAQYFGTRAEASPAASVAPEPSTLLLAAIGWICIAGRRNRRRKSAHQDPIHRPDKGESTGCSH